MRLRKWARAVLPVYLLGIYVTLGVARTVTEWVREAGFLRLTVGVAFTVTAAVSLWALSRDPKNRSPKVVAALVAAAGLYAAVVLPMQSPEEKLHFIQYGLVALLAWAGAPGRAKGTWRPAFAAALTLGAGWLDEAIQGLLPNRYYDLRDVGFNLAAGVMALGVLEAVRYIRGRSAGPSLEAGEVKSGARTASASAPGGAAPRAG